MEQTERREDGVRGTLEPPVVLLVRPVRPTIRNHVNRSLHTRDADLGGELTGDLAESLRLCRFG